MASKMNVVPDVWSYTTLMRGWCEQGCEDRAIEVMERMKAAAGPDVVTLTTDRSYCKDRNMRAAMSLLEHEADRIETRSYLHHTHARLIELKDMDRAKDLFNRWRETNEGPTVVMGTVIWLGSIDETNGHGREGDASFNE